MAYNNQHPHIRRRTHLVREAARLTKTKSCGDDSNASITRMIANTYKGQAAMAGSGPEGETCKDCVHWDKPDNVYDYKDGSYIFPQKCMATSRQLPFCLEKESGWVPADAFACCEFEKR